MTEFINTDKISDAFRYPINKSGETNLSGLDKINLRSFIDEITPIVSELEGMTSAISVYEDYMAEMQSHYF